MKPKPSIRSLMTNFIFALAVAGAPWIVHAACGPTQAGACNYGYQCVMGGKSVTDPGGISFNLIHGARPKGDGKTQGYSYSCQACSTIKEGGVAAAGGGCGCASGSHAVYGGVGYGKILNKCIKCGGMTPIFDGQQCKPITFVHCDAKKNQHLFKGKCVQCGTGCKFNSTDGSCSCSIKNTQWNAK